MQPTGYFEYVLELLDDFTPHHRRVYETIDLLEQADISPLRTGTIYKAYHNRCEVAGVTPLSERRIGNDNPAGELERATETFLERH